MHELIKERTPLAEVHGLVLYDTCFIFWMIEQHRLAELLRHEGALTSFNALELVHVAHRRPHYKLGVRRYLRSAPLIVDVPVVPGDRAAERAFVAATDPQLLQHVHDPSDAVLLAAAIRTQSDVVTRDKHHLFTVELENYVQRFGIRVVNDVSTGN